MRKLAAGLLSCYALAWASDWVSEAGDPQRTNSQPRERVINTTTVKKLQLIWKLTLGDKPATLSSPIVIGKWPTHRGTVELVFVTDGNGGVYAVDGDLGKLFWKRQLEGSSVACPEARVPTPVLTPLPPEIDLEKDDDAPQPPRPLYVVAPDGRLHALAPTDGKDAAGPWPFLPAGANASALSLSGTTIYATTSGKCNNTPDGIWALDLNQKPSFTPLRYTDGPGGMTVGVNGTIYTAITKTLQAIAPINQTWADGETSIHPAAFSLGGTEWIAGAGKGGRLFLTDLQQKMVRATATLTGLQGDVATWEDGKGVRWIYGVVQSLTAFRIETKSGIPALGTAWKARDLASPSAPVVAGGVVFILSNGGHATLHAFDSTTGKQLYSSGDQVKVKAGAGGLSVANGHVCFTGVDHTLYCFGFPLDI